MLPPATPQDSNLTEEIERDDAAGAPLEERKPTDAREPERAPHRATPMVGANHPGGAPTSAPAAVRRPSVYIAPRKMGARRNEGRSWAGIAIGLALMAVLVIVVVRGL